jgi:chromosome segregation ATPase
MKTNARAFICDHLSSWADRYAEAIPTLAFDLREAVLEIKLLREQEQAEHESLHKMCNDLLEKTLRMDQALARAQALETELQDLLKATLPALEAAEMSLHPEPGVRDRAPAAVLCMIGWARNRLSETFLRFPP